MLYAEGWNKRERETSLFSIIHAQARLISEIIIALEKSSALKEYDQKLLSESARQLLREIRNLSEEQQCCHKSPTTVKYG